MKLRIDNIRMSYTQALFSPQQVQGQGKPKFSASFIFPKDHPQLPAINAAIIEVAKAKWGAKHMDVLTALKAADRLPVHDGDGKEAEGYKGNLYINASSELRPAVFDGDVNPVTVSDGLAYSGANGSVLLEFWAMDNQYGKRVNATLLGVQTVQRRGETRDPARHGYPLAGGSVASASDFQAATPTGGTVAKDGAASLF